MQDLSRAGISMKEETDKLTTDGVKLSQTPLTSCWLQSKKARSKRIDREPTERLPCPETLAATVLLRLPTGSPAAK